MPTKGEKKSVANGMVQCDTKLDGKTVLITGSNTGIGFIAAIDMLKRGAKLIMACRSMSKMEDAKAKMLEEVKDAQIVLQTLDLNSLDSVRECAQKVNESEERLDILINNAGIMLCPPGKTTDGFDKQLGINHVGHFLFTNLLLDLVKKSAPSRIITVASSLHGESGIMWKNINQDNTHFNSLKAYGQSKSANIMHMKELAKRLEGTGVTCYSLHPGTIKTDLWKSLGDVSHLPFKTRAYVSKVMAPYFSVAGKSPEKGAQNTIYCAVAPELEKSSGEYYTNFTVTAPARHCRSPADWEKLWKLTEELIENAGKKNDAEGEGESKQEQTEDAPAEGGDETKPEDTTGTDGDETKPDDANGGDGDETNPDDATGGDGDETKPDDANGGDGDETKQEEAKDQEAPAQTDDVTEQEDATDPQVDASTEQEEAKK